MTLFDRARAHKMETDHEREEADARAHAEAIRLATSRIRLLLRTILKLTPADVPDPTDIKTSDHGPRPVWVSMELEVDGVRFYGTHQPNSLSTEIRVRTTTNDGELVRVGNLYELAELIEQGRIAPPASATTTHERFAR